MNRRIALILLMSLLFTIPIFAAVDTDGESVPHGIRNNEYYLESVRLTKLAHETFEYGDYDASAGFAEEAIRYVQLSNEFIALQLIVEAKRYLDWADANNISGLYPNEYNEGKINYEVSVITHFNEEWNESISASIVSIEILSSLEALFHGTPAAMVREPSSASSASRPAALTSTGTARRAADGTPLPSQYTVRPWATAKDCLWNIAGYSWVYGDPWQWKVLYEANKSKLPDPNNPDLINPGMVLDIPARSGETRQGMWDQNKTY